jgi:hypothetical protein
MNQEAKLAVDYHAVMEDHDLEKEYRGLSPLFATQLQDRLQLNANDETLRQLQALLLETFTMAFRSCQSKAKHLKPTYKVKTPRINRLIQQRSRNSSISQSLSTRWSQRDSGIATETSSSRLSEMSWDDGGVTSLSFRPGYVIGGVSAEIIRESIGNTRSVGYISTNELMSGEVSGLSNHVQGLQGQPPRSTPWVDAQGMPLEVINPQYSGEPSIYLERNPSLVSVSMIPSNYSQSTQPSRQLSHQPHTFPGIFPQQVIENTGPTSTSDQIIMDDTFNPTTDYSNNAYLGGR